MLITFYTKWYSNIVSENIAEQIKKAVKDMEFFSVINYINKYSCTLYESNMFDIYAISCNQLRFLNW